MWRYVRLWVVNTVVIGRNRSPQSIYNPNPHRHAANNSTDRGAARETSIDDAS